MPAGSAASTAPPWSTADTCRATPRAPGSPRPTTRSSRRSPSTISTACATSSSASPRASRRVWNPPWSDYRHGANTEALLDLEGVRVQYLGTMLSHRFGFSLWIEGEQGVIWTNRRQVFWRPGGSQFFRPVRRVKVPPGDDAKYPKGGTTSLLNSSLRDAVAGRGPRRRQHLERRHGRGGASCRIRRAHRPDRRGLLGRRGQRAVRPRKGLEHTDVAGPADRSGQRRCRPDRAVVREGRLPTLAQLRADGVWGGLRTTAEVMHVSAWPSIYTGTTPGHHGMYHAYQTRAGEQTALRTRPEWCARPPFWKFLDDAGRKSSSWTPS